jgi:MarR family transcriptional regulator, temperature-dependent positive regulator of motility
MRDVPNSADENPGPDRSPEFLRTLRRAHAVVERRVLTRLAEAGFADLRPAHLAVLRYVQRDGRRITDLARDTGVSRQAVSQVVAELERLGVVVQEPDPCDRRARIVRHTERGQRGRAIAIAAFRAIEDELAAVIGTGSMSRLLRDLQTLEAIAALDGRR